MRSLRQSYSLGVLSICWGICQSARSLVDRRLYLPVDDQLHLLIVSDSSPDMYSEYLLTHGLNRDVRTAPCVSSPLCCRMRLGGLGVEPTYVRLELGTAFERSR
jgi:hypothetical protein